MFLRYGYYLWKAILWRETPYAAPPKVRAGVEGVLQSAANLAISCLPGAGIPLQRALIAGAINSAPLLSDFFGYFLVR